MEIAEPAITGEVPAQPSILGQQPMAMVGAGSPKKVSRLFRFV